MAKEDFELPEPDERDTLLAGLARLISQRGAEQFLTAPILFPDPRFFPDPVEQRGRGVGSLIRRLMAYAGLAEMNLVLEIDEDLVSIVDGRGAEYHVGQAAGWFHGIRDDTCHFGVDNRELSDFEGLIGTLGHEVAHAYRDHHGLVAVDRDIEEKLTDLTTVYLGFGVFTLDSSFQFKTGHFDAHGRQLLYERKQRGYLSPGQLALLLGVQLVVRNSASDEVGAIESALAPDQRALLKQARKELARQRNELIDALHLPPEATWPVPKPFADVVVPLPAASVRVNDRPKQRRAREKDDDVAFRVHGNHGCAGVVIGLAVAFAAVMLLAQLGAGVWLLAVGSVIAGSVGGRRTPSTRCSGCRRVTQRSATRCASCGLELVGDIAELADVFEAEAAWRRSWKQRRRP